jgi:hypothetical protein
MAMILAFLQVFEILSSLGILQKNPHNHERALGPRQTRNAGWILSFPGAVPVLTVRRTLFSSLLRSLQTASCLGLPADAVPPMSNSSFKLLVAGYLCNIDQVSGNCIGLHWMMVHSGWTPCCDHSADEGHSIFEVNSSHR